MISINVKEVNLVNVCALSVLALIYWHPTVIPLSRAMLHLYPHCFCSLSSYFKTNSLLAGKLSNQRLRGTTSQYVLIIHLRGKNCNYQINRGVIRGFPALRKAVTTHVKKYDIFSRVLIYPISCLHVTRLWCHSVRLMNERQSLHDSKYKLFVGAFSNYGG